MQVHPYKLKTFEWSELNRLVGQYGENYVVDQLGTIAYDVYLAKKNDTSEKTISLPVDVKSIISMYEKSEIKMYN